MQGFAYQFPDLNDPVFPIGAVAEDGEAQMAGFLKITAETYLFVNSEYADPLTRWQTLLRLHDAVTRDAAKLGLSEISCVVPPNLSKAFHRRLERLGWQEEPKEWKRMSLHLRNVNL